jgi:hypothetical protein
MECENMQVHSKKLRKYAVQLSACYQQRIAVNDNRLSRVTLTLFVIFKSYEATNLKLPSTSKA